jgi:protease-4
MSKIKKPIWNKEDKIDKIMKKLSASIALNINTYFPKLILK